MINAVLGKPYSGNVSRGKEDMYHVDSTKALHVKERVMTMLIRDSLLYCM